MTVFLNLRAGSVGGGPAAEVRVLATEPDEPETLADLVEWVRGKDVLLATHGFNVDQQDGIASLSHWQERLSLPASTLFIGALWAGDAWVPVIDYPFEGDDATQSGKLLADFLNRHFDEVASLTFASHSLGARMVLETIAHLERRIRRLVLMAGAIDDTCLHDEYRDAAAKVDAISLLASRGDWVLEFAFPVGNFFGGIVSRGHPYVHAALGREGPARANLANLRPGWQIPDGWRYGHGDYFPDQTGTGLPLPVDIPPQPAPAAPNDKASWSAGFVSTRIV
jgi:esterase/lipase superfamily enzyme